MEAEENVKTEETPKAYKSRSKTVKKVFGWIGFALSCALLLGLTVNALLALFLDHYYPTFGGSRLFSIVSDSMEPEIPTGSMIVGRVPDSEDEIQVGSVITYEWRQGNGITLITHRVVEVRSDAETGITYYITRGDNAGGVDAVRPVFSDVVGIYTGQRCAFFGYFFGFLQSAEGVIALIVILLIIVITIVIVHFVNLVNVWRTLAVDALKKSGSMLSETQVEGLGVIADVLGIVSKEPVDKADVKRKDKKLKWFIKTGALPKRPYNDDLDENAAFAGGGKIELGLPPVAEQQIETAITPASAPESSAVIRERFENASYKISYQARLVRLDGQAKEWYSLVKNELLSYKKVRVRTTNRFESFLLGGRVAARLTVRGKTLCLCFAGNPADYENSKYAVRSIKSGTPCLYRLQSARRIKYACGLIAELMKKFGAEKEPGYEQQDFYPPYEGFVTLLQKGLIERRIVAKEKVYRITELETETEKRAAVADGERTDKTE